jgi:AIR synthase-related protein
LVKAACALALNEGALRFDAQVQDSQRAFFGRLGWREVREVAVQGRPHALMRWPIDRIARLAASTKQPLGDLVGGMLGGDPRWRGDDGVPVPGTGVVACTDAITPSMVERDPEWAGWCGILVTAHDLAAMGAAPVGALDAVAAADAESAGRVMAGLRRASEAFGLPILGGHTQLGVPAALSVTGLGATHDPVPGGGARPGDELTVSADLGGGWRPGYHGRQWDSTTTRSREELRAMHDVVARARPRAAKDVSMAGIAGTAGMLAEASGCGAELEVAAVPRPDGAAGGDWLTCFPGFAMVTADRPGAPPPPAAPAVAWACGVVTRQPGVRLAWPDGEVTTAIGGPVTGLGQASEEGA